MLDPQTSICHTSMYVKHLLRSPMADERRLTAVGGSLMLHSFSACNTGRPGGSVDTLRSLLTHSLGLESRCKHPIWDSFSFRV